MKNRILLPLASRPRTESTPINAHTKWGEKRHEYGLKHAYIPWMVILGDYGIKKTSFETSIFELPRVKNCMCRLCTNPLGGPPPPGPNTQIG